MATRVGFALLLGIPWASVLCCENTGHAIHVLDPAEQAADRVAPSRVQVQLEELKRGDSDFCKGDADVVLKVVAAADDRTPPDRLGFRIRVAAGTAPVPSTLSDEPIKPFSDLLILYWLEGTGRSGDERPIDALDFQLTVSAVDLAGNEGPPSLPIRVVDHRTPKTGVDQAQLRQ